MSDADFSSSIFKCEAWIHTVESLITIVRIRSKIADGGADLLTQAGELLVIHVEYAHGEG